MSRFLISLVLATLVAIMPVFAQPDHGIFFNSFQTGTINLPNPGQPMPLKVMGVTISNGENTIEAITKWRFYVSGTLASSCVAACLTEWNGVSVTPYNFFTQVRADLAWVEFFSASSPRLLNPGQVDSLLLIVDLQLTGAAEGVFGFNPNTHVSIRPRPSFVLPNGRLLGATVVYEPPAPFVEITQLPIPSRTYHPGDVNVQVEAWSYYSNVPTEIRQFDLEISSEDTAVMYNVFLNNRITNIRIQCPGYTSTPLGIVNGGWTVLGNVYFQIRDYVRLSEIGVICFEVICDLDSTLNPGNYYFTLGNSAGWGYCFGPCSIINLNNNQFIRNISPSVPITWPLVVSPPEYHPGGIDGRGTDVSVSNFPNPFNPETHLSFTLPEASKVSLIVYDISGREVARLINGFQSAGFHEVTFNAPDLPSGVYFARLTAGTFQQTQKLLLVK